MSATGYYHFGRTSNNVCVNMIVAVVAVAVVVVVVEWWRTPRLTAATVVWCNSMEFDFTLQNDSLVLWWAGEKKLCSGEWKTHAKLPTMEEQTGSAIGLLSLRAHTSSRPIFVFAKRDNDNSPPMRNSRETKAKNRNNEKIYMKWFFFGE